MVVLQHGQGGGVQVMGQAAHCWRWRGLATSRAVQRQGGGVPGPAGRGVPGTCEHWRGRPEVLPVDGRRAELRLLPARLKLGGERDGV